MCVCVNAVCVRPSGFNARERERERERLAHCEKVLEEMEEEEEGEKYKRSEGVTVLRGGR